MLNKGPLRKQDKERLLAEQDAKPLTIKYVNKNGKRKFRGHAKNLKASQLFS